MPGSRCSGVRLPTFVIATFLKGLVWMGKIGFIWTFLQGWWYRTLVDAKIFEIKKACGNDKEKIRSYLKERYGIDLSEMA